jgi:hypothetical protein
MMSLCLVQFSYASCSLSSVRECDIKGLRQLIGEIIKSMSSEKYGQELAGLKDKFKATEIKKIGSRQISFWTMAYCPDSGTRYDYDKDILSGYIIDSCKQGNKGSHGGCKTCVMSEIVIHEASDGEAQGDIATGVIEIDPSDAKIDKEKAFKQIFSGRDMNYYQDGNGVHITPKDDSRYPDYYLKKILLSSFSGRRGKEYLFMISENGGHYRSNSINLYLFDSNMDILAKMEDGDYSHLVSAHPFYCKGKGITYMLYSRGGCPNGGYCTYGEPSLLRYDWKDFVEENKVSIGLFGEDIQYVINGNDLLIYSAQGVSPDYVCDGLDKKGLPGIYRDDSNFVPSKCIDFFDPYKDTNPKSVVAFLYAGKVTFNQDTCNFYIDKEINN